MKNILIISFSNISKDPRVLRQINYFSKDYKITVIGYSNPKINNVSFHEITKERKGLFWYIKLFLLFLRLHNVFYFCKKEVSQIKKIKNLLVQPDIIIANDYDTLKASLIFKNENNILVFDAHEYSPEENTDSFIWNLLMKKFIDYNIKNYAIKADIMVTVSHKIIEKYQSEYNLKALLLTNAPFYFENEIIFSNDSKIRLIHHGLALESRKIENMIYMMDFLDDRFELDLMLVPNKMDYYNKLTELCLNRKNVKIIGPVNFQEIISFSSQYDVGVFLLEPTNFNYEFALPNKFFEFIAANLAIAIGPSTEMVRILNKYNIGIFSTSFDPRELAMKLSNLSKDQINQYKLNSKNAFKELSASKGFENLENEIIIKYANSNKTKKY